MANKIRLGLIGASVSGTWSARSHVPALQASSDVELTAVCTSRADSAEATRRAWGARLAFDDWRKLVASPEIEVVAAVVRVPSHYLPTKGSLEAANPSVANGRSGSGRRPRPWNWRHWPRPDGSLRRSICGPASILLSCAPEGTARGGLCRRGHGGPRQPAARRR